MATKLALELRLSGALEPLEFNEFDEFDELARRSSSAAASASLPDMRWP